MIISFLIGYAIGTLIGAIIDIAFKIYSTYNAKDEIRAKAKAQLDQDNILFKFVKSTSQCEDEDELVIEAYNYNKEHIANINVTAPKGARIRVGEIF